MTVRFPVFTECASDQTLDPVIRDIFVALSHGIFPFCVRTCMMFFINIVLTSEEEEGGETHLLFRRSTHSTEKDKTQRLATQMTTGTHTHMVVMCIPRGGRTTGESLTLMCF
jgi:hypothetical protein